MVSLVSAQDAAPAGEPAKPCANFKKLDKDGDGSITKEEFLASAKDDAQKAKMETRFGKLDKDGDGKVTPAEMNSGKAAGPKKEGKGKGKGKGPKPQ